MKLLELPRDRRLHLRVHVAGVENGDAAREVDVALALHVPELRVGGAIGVDGKGVRDAARNGILRGVADRHSKSRSVLRPVALACISALGGCPYVAVAG